MKPIQIKTIVRAVGGELLQGDENLEVTSVGTNSREMGKNSLFVPIKGERVDGHKFVQSAFQNGSIVCFTSDKNIVNELQINQACIYVENTLKALQSFATFYRELYQLPVIGITGSVGKTTTKEMVAAVLETKFRVLKTFGNMNSQIGVSLMMFHLDESYDVAVIEMGISEKNEMDILSSIAKPSIAVMTNIGVSHIGQLGSQENICKEKANIINRFPEQGGRLFVCGNDPLLIKLCDRSKQSRFLNRSVEVTTYGTENGLDVTGSEIQIENDKQKFVFCSNAKKTEVTLSVLGLHNVRNAVVALSIGELLGVDCEMGKKGLFEYQPLKMRGEIIKKDGITIVDDTYNASPDSIKTGINMLFDFEKVKRKILVLADVLELGEMSQTLHEDIGSFILECRKQGKNINTLVTVGKEASYISDLVSKAESEINVKQFMNNNSAIEYLNSEKESGDIILVKGSRGMHMDEVVRGITD